MNPRALLGAALVPVVLMGACGGESSDDGSTPIPVEDPGPVHVHGLGVNPADGALFVATHTGLFRAARGERRAVRVGDRFQDTMGFAVVGPDRFLGSGHPDGRDDLPPFLGLIRSTDAGRSWKPLSLLGERDFHVLKAAGRRVYGYGSDFKTRRAGLLVSDDGGRSWQERPAPEPLVSLAIDPEDPARVVAAGEQALYVSRDGGASWEDFAAPGGYVAWADRLVVVGAAGTVSSTPHPGAPLRRVGRLGGPPAALESGPRGELYAARHDGTIERSDDGGANWTIRSAP